MRKRYIGIARQNIAVPRKVFRYYNLAAENGILVISMDERSPAAIVGLREGDIIIEYGGRFRALMNYIRF